MIHSEVGPNSVSVIRHFSNPFCTRWTRPGALPYQFTDQTRDIAAQRIASDLEKFRLGAIVGPHGTGKSTLLQTLVSHSAFAHLTIAQVQLQAPPVSDRGCFRRWLDRGNHQRRLAGELRTVQAQLSPARHTLLIIDGAEQLRASELRRTIRTARLRNQLVLITCHAPISYFVTLHETQFHEEIVAQLASQLLADCPPGLHSHVAAYLESSSYTQASNVRDLWFELYDVCNQWMLRPH